MFDTPRQAAQWLFEAHAARRAFVPLPSRPAGDGLPQAYDIQDALVDLLAPKHGRSVGYKIGLTTPRMQQMCGIDHPIAGRVLAGRVLHAPLTVNLSDFVRLGVECELAVRLARPLPADPTIADVQDCLKDVAAAFELVEDRAADYRALDLYSLVADNSWNAGVVLGAPRPLSDLGDLAGMLTLNGKVADRGSSRDVLGHPLEAVAWLARHLAQRGTALAPDQWVMTGSIVPTKFANRGDVFIFAVEGLEPVSLTVR